MGDQPPILVARARWNADRLMVEGSAWLELGDSMIEGSLSGRQQGPADESGVFPATLVFTLRGDNRSSVRLVGNVRRSVDNDGVTIDGWTSLDSVSARGCLGSFADVPIALHVTEPGTDAATTSTTSTTRSEHA
jgi:hypothetical protein